MNLSIGFCGPIYHTAKLPASSGGAIIDVAAILGTVGFADAPAYTAAKHDMVGLIRTAMLEYSALALRVNAVGPAFIRTPMIAALEQDEATRTQLVGMHPIG